MAVRDWSVPGSDVVERATRTRSGPAEHPLVDLQRQAGNRAVSALVVQRREAGEETPVRASIDEALRGSGQALPGGLRSRVEAHLGADLSGVRVHTGGAAARSARAMAAESYTVGEDVVFGAGQYDPSSSRGQHLIAHELAHVVQQRRGPVSGTHIGDGVAVSDPSDGFERAAEASAQTFVQTRQDAHVHDAGCGHHHGAPSPGRDGAAGGPVQRSAVTVQRHSSFEHKLIGDLTPEQLSAIGAHSDVKGGKDVELPNGTITKEEVLHVLAQEIRRLTYFQSSPPRGEVKDIKSETERLQKLDALGGDNIFDKEWDVQLVAIPTTRGKTFLITYGEMNTLADFFGNPKELLGMDPVFIDRIIRGVRQDSLQQLIKMYAKTKGKWEWQVRKELGVKSTKFLNEKGKDDAQGTTGVLNELKLLGVGPAKGKPLANKEDTSTSYGSTLARNACHFAPESWHQWFAYHTKARDLAKQAYAKYQTAGKVEDLAGDKTEADRIRGVADELFNDAMLQNGFGDHYLQDSYAGGHLINKTKIMQWYVKWLDKNPNIDFHRNSNWRKAQDIAYGQKGMVSDEQYDKSNVTASVQEDGRTRSSAQNPQAAHNYGESWQEEAAVLGLEIPSSIASDTTARQLLIEWQKLSAQSSRNQVKTVDALAKIVKRDVTAVIDDLGKLMADGIVRFDSYSTGDRRRGEGIKDVLRPGSYVRLRDEYKPKNLKEFNKIAPTKGGDDSAFKEKALGVQYREYLEFMNSSFIQKSTNDLHNKFCKEGVTVKAGNGPAIFKVYGDEAMFNKGAAEGLQHSGETAKQSRDNIISIAHSGTAKQSSEEILARLPASVVVDGNEMTLAAWHSEGGPLQTLCESSIFPKIGAVTGKFAPGVASPELGTISKNPHPEQGF